MTRFRVASLFLIVAGLLLPSVARAADPTSNDAWVDSRIEDLLTLYRHLHTHPELSFKEFETAKRIAEELRKAGCEVTEGVGKMGVVGVLKNGAGPTVMVRTDLDALPVTEATGLALRQQGENRRRRRSERRRDARLRA